LNILVDGIIFARQRYGGISRVWEEYLSRLPNYGINVHLLIPRHHKNSSLTRILANRDSYRIVQDYFYWPRRFFEKVPVRSEFLKNHLDPSIQLFQSTYFSTVYRTQIPKVVMIYDMIPEKFQGPYPDKWNNLEIVMKRIVLQNSDHIIAISNATKKDLLEIYPDIHPEKITVIHNGIDRQSKGILPSFEAIIQKQHLDLQPGSYFLYVGLRNGYKNFKIIVELLQKFPKYQNYRFLCIGGEDYGDLSAWLRSNNLHQNFLFLDFLSNEELSVFYKNAQALIYPSQYEGFGLPILEAMANSCPVVCSDTSSLPEVGGDAAFYFDPYSIESLDLAITKLFSSSRAEIIESGLRNIERFSWDLSTQSLVKLYRDLVQVNC
jgi:glycosyltransferase involved in cell wall biosynthesis